MLRLLDNRTGKTLEPKTEFAYRKIKDLIYFEFIAHDSSLTSYSSKNNDLLYKGDVVEVFLAFNDNEYYEFEVAPNGATFIAKIINKQPIFIDNNFFKSESIISNNSYHVKMKIDLSKFENIKEIKFNAFRIETKGIRQDYILQAYSPTLCNTFHIKEKFVELI